MDTEAHQPATYPFALAPLPYAYDALAPVIDAEALRVHHTKLHQAYIDKLNAALEPHPELHGFGIEELLKRVDKLPISIRQTVYDQGGGHFHHELFWQMLTPSARGSSPSGTLADAIERGFGSFDAFKEKFVDIGSKHFASGWVFLALDPANAQLEVFSRSDHNNILQDKKHPLLFNDLWEHAYYLPYRSDRLRYLESFWGIVNWDYVAQRYESAPVSKNKLARAPKRFL